MNGYQKLRKQKWLLVGFMQSFIELYYEEKLKGHPENEIREEAKKQYAYCMQEMERLSEKE